MHRQRETMTKLINALKYAINYGNGDNPLRWS